MLLASDSICLCVTKSAIYVGLPSLGDCVGMKVMDVMTQCKAIVSTAVGGESNRLTESKKIQVADEPSPFLDHCLTLVCGDSLRREMGDAACALVAAEHVWLGLDTKPIEGNQQGPEGQS